VSGFRDEYDPGNLCFSWTTPVPSLSTGRPEVDRGKMEGTTRGHAEGILYARNHRHVDPVAEQNRADHLTILRRANMRCRILTCSHTVNTLALHRALIPSLKRFDLGRVLAYGLSS
jgi:hypothetical protein